MKNTIPILLILASVGIFLGYIKPGFEATGARRQELSTYQDTLRQVEELEVQITSLQQQIAAINPSDMARLQKLLPETVNNVNLIIDINTIASNFNLAPRNISIDEPEAKSETALQRDDSLYNSLDFSFSVNSTYPNFSSFVEALEKSLRLVDITSISFSPGETDTYEFKVNLRTYWLK